MHEKAGLLNQNLEVTVKNQSRWDEMTIFSDAKTNFAKLLYNARK